MLAACSPYFRTVFSSLPSHQHPVIVIGEVEDYTLDLLLQYMYLGSVSVSPSQIESFVKAARSLNIDGLKDLVVQVNNSFRA